MSYTLTDLSPDGWSVYNAQTRDDIRCRGPNAKRNAEAIHAVLTGRASHADWAARLDASNESVGLCPHCKNSSVSPQYAGKACAQCGPAWAGEPTSLAGFV